VLLGESLYREGQIKDAAVVLGRFAKSWPQSPSRPRAEVVLALVDAREGRDADAAHRLGILREAWPASEIDASAMLAEAQCRQRLAVRGAGKPDREELDRAARLYTLAGESGNEAVVPEARLGSAQLARIAGRPDEAGKTLDDLLSGKLAEPIADA